MKGQKSWKEQKHEQQMKEISSNAKKRKAKEANNGDTKRKG